MASVIEIMQLCRLCLEKDEVNTPIFEGQSDRQIFLKISACLPVKVSKEDKLPKNICDGCSCKLEMLYQFWNTSANAEKKLIRWLDQIGTDKLSDKEEAAVALQSQHSISSDPVVLKQEVVDVADNQSTGDDLVPDDLNVSNDSQEYLLQQEQLPYQPVEFQFQQDGFDAETADDNLSQNVESEPLPKQRKRRAAAMKALPAMDSEDEDDPDLINTKIAKTEEQSEESGGEDMTEPTTFVGVPSADDDEQPGPSGVGKASGDAPYFGEMGIRKVKVASGDNRTLEKYKKLFDKYKSKYRLKQEVVLLGNLDKLDVKKFKPSRAMKKLLERSKPKPSAQEKLSIFGKSYEKQKYECKRCRETFENELQLKRHKMVHFIKKDNTGIKRNYSCYICRKSFAERSSLWAHVRQHTQPLTHKCKDCNVIFKTVGELQTHRVGCVKDDKLQAATVPVSNAESGYRYRCNICLKKFADVFEMREHKESHYEKDILPVQNGTSEVETHNEYQSTSKDNSQETLLLTCDVCEDVFEDGDLFLEHAEFHKSPTESDLSVSETRKQSPCSSPSDDNTEDDCDEESKLIINDCVEEFRPKIFLKSMSDLMPKSSSEKIPKKRKFNKSPDNLKCDECNFKFKRYRSLRRHNRIAISKYKCWICCYTTCSGKKFRLHAQSQHDVLNICLKCKKPCDEDTHGPKKPKSKTSKKKSVE